MTATTARDAAEHLATEIAWNGAASPAWIARKLAGFDVDPAAVTEFAVQFGLLSEIPRLGGYTVTRKVNARVFGEAFAEWVAA